MVKYIIEWYKGKTGYASGRYSSKREALKDSKKVKGSKIRKVKEIPKSQHKKAIASFRKANIFR